MQRFFLVGALAALSLQAQEFKLGGKVADFPLQRLDGSGVNFKDLKGDVTVVTWTSLQCPISNDYNERMNAVFEEYSKKGVKFVFVNSNATESPDGVAAHAKANFKFPVYKDADNVVADRFGAQVTPESFVIDKTGAIVYHGYIDDSRNASKISDHGLKNALDAVLAGKAVAKAETKAFGCTLKRAKKVS
jgi:peroxiredoxin